MEMENQVLFHTFIRRWQFQFPYKPPGFFVWSRQLLSFLLSLHGAPELQGTNVLAVSLALFVSICVTNYQGMTKTPVCISL